MRAELGQEAPVSCLKTAVREFTLEGTGKDRAEAAASVFAQLRRRAPASVEGLLIQMEPRDILLLEEEEKTRVQRLLGFFAPRELAAHRLRLKVVVTIRYI